MHETTISQLILGAAWLFCAYVLIRIVIALRSDDNMPDSEVVKGKNNG